MRLGMDAGSVVIDEALARRLVASQFPPWAGLEVRRITPGGWDNRSFRLGEELDRRRATAGNLLVRCGRARPTTRRQRSRGA